MRTYASRSLLVLGLLLLVPTADVSAAATCTNGELINGVCVPSASSTGLPDTAADTVVINIMNWLLGMLGLLAMIMFVVSGIMYLTAGGDEKRTESAKNNIKYAVIGVAVALLGYAVVFTVQQIVTGGASGTSYGSSSTTGGSGVKY
ncbi:MAG: hypothetical protein HGA38_00160 [Candidatus Moranbacteria bacterium]|nr:hypothetical protein [Candidatus Moranbacteria bacterium]NTW45952.1 hypothetical protein [Candidatus Moranbacteria bacterium]